MADSTDGAFEQQDRFGTVLAGKYHLEKLLGEGGMASVYRARHRNGSRVAVKILHRVLSVEKDIRERFLHEGYAANASGHKGAVHVIDDDVSGDGSVFLVMEYLDGVCVEELWDASCGQLPPRLVLSIVAGLLDILVTAHENRVIHRDVKPDNIFVTREGDIKLLDFGIARLPQGMRSSTPTETGARFGTPAFMPPEQARGNVREIDARSDVFAVGAVVFTLTSGRYLFDCSNPGDYLIKAATEPARSLSSVLPDIPLSVAEVTDKALSFDKEDRWRSAGAMLEAVRAVCVERYGGVLSKEQLAEVVRAATAGPSEPPPRPEASLAAPVVTGDTEPAAPTIADSGKKVGPTGSDVASVRTASFASKPSPSRHLWLLGFGAIVLVSFVAAVVVGARSVTDDGDGIAAGTPEVAARSADPAELPEPEDSEHGGASASAAGGARSARIPTTSAVGSKGAPPEEPPLPPQMLETAQPKTAQPKTAQPAKTAPAPPAPSEPDDYDPYLYQ